MKIVSDKTKELSRLICDFFIERPALSVKKIEETLGVPLSTINRAIKKNTAIPDKHIYPIICEISRYGFTYKGYTLKTDENGTLFGSKLSDEPGRDYEVRTYPDGRTEEIDITDYDYSQDYDDSPQEPYTSSFHKTSIVYTTMWNDHHDL